MNNYDFSTLNDKELETLVRDLLNEKYNLHLQSFKAGKDKGIDLRYSTSKNDNTIVVQVKHYLSSNFYKLKETFEKKEFDKINKLKPERYIIATSLSLSAKQKDILKDILHPYILDSNDIFGKEDLNRLLGEFANIEKRYYKLWFSSVNVFNAVVNNAIEGRTRYLLEQIKERIRFYVMPDKLKDAIHLLAKEKIILITGQPGIGKTTLAEIILFDRASCGYKIHKVENIREAEDIISPSDEEKQIFYFDDFLGSNYLEIINAHRTETQLTSFVDRVKRTPNKYLLLTTRTVILNQAVDRYEKISRSLPNNKKIEIKLDDYSLFEKALILYNHLYFRLPKGELQDAIVKDKFYNTIVKHKNYTPRIIEFLTDSSHIENLSSGNYRNFILNNLDNPSEIWSHSFEKQIDHFERCLLLTLFTFQEIVSEDILIEAYARRLKYEKEECNQIINSNQFYNSIRILQNGFIVSSIENEKNTIRTYSFINPSLTDFLISYVASSLPVRESIISSVVYTQQLQRFNPRNAVIPLERELETIIREKLDSSQMKMIFRSKEESIKNNVRAEGAWILCQYCSHIDSDNVILGFIERITFDNDWKIIHSKMKYILDQIDGKPLTFNYIKTHFSKIIEKMLTCIKHEYETRNIHPLFEKFQYDYLEYSKSTNGERAIKEMIESILEHKIGRIESDAAEYNKIDQVTQLYDEAYETKMRLANKFLPYVKEELNVSIDLDMDEGYWEDIINENCKQNDVERDNYEEEFRNRYFDRQQRDEPENSIDELFHQDE